ncbi:Transcriptional regulator, MarR family [Serinicoccus hydrothermalis]|uniref:Transcriptional regulator, MarR family n=1 Tax=Serinicoccus hydrothermalis TaxID=1758689 RepID=A0A1B1NDX7_9MICO|nr:MarR family transcriptional regulator [Serinicoccus hydrothermalis]ANS79650.1 Transcriptional regulator, MarR family [Serinicoccus hydrothermalis]
MTERSTDAAAQDSREPQTRWVDGWEPGAVLDALRRLLDSGRRANPALARRAGLTHTELAVLEHVMDEPVGPTELAQRLGVTSAAASGIVDRLVARGHAQRQPHPTDRRRTAVVATDSGREELMGHLVPMFSELQQVDAELTEEEREVVLRFLLAADRAVGRLL